jgi:methionyl-tRNA formyltransferase
MTKPRIVVLGEKPQGATWLRFLLESGKFDIVAGVPRWKEPGWWKQDDFQALLEEHHIPVIHREDLGSYEYDILWSLMYGFIIEAEHIERAKWFGLNLHESPLPRYRGCNGYTHSILEGADTFGTTFHFLAAALDAGEVIDQEIFASDPDETSKELYNRTIDVSNSIFKRNIDAVASKSVKGRHIDVSSEPIRPRSSLMELKEISHETLKDAVALYRAARAFDFLPFEPAFFQKDGQKFYVFVEGSLARGQKKMDAIDLKNEDLPFLLEKAKKGTALRITAFKRPLLMMDSEFYAKNFEIFVPRSAWIAGKTPATVGT